MSTKKRLLEVVKKISDIDKAERTAFSQINAYEITQDLPKLEKELVSVYEELVRKQNTPITNDLLLSNGICDLKDFEIECGYGYYWHDTSLRTILDFEDALALCGIDKDIAL